MKSCIVVVSSDQGVVDNIVSALQVDSQFDIQGFTDSTEALDLAGKRPVDVFISDYRLTGPDGLKVLPQVRELQPESSRMLLLGHDDAKCAAEAINRSALFQYLEKPWDDEQLLVAVRSGSERAQLLRTLKEKVDELGSAHAALKMTRKRLIEAFL